MFRTLPQASLRRPHAGSLLASMVAAALVFATSARAEDEADATPPRPGHLTITVMDAELIDVLDAIGRVTGKKVRVPSGDLGTLQSYACEDHPADQALAELLKPLGLSSTVAGDTLSVHSDERAAAVLLSPAAPLAPFHFKLGAPAAAATVLGAERAAGVFNHPVDASSGVVEMGDAGPRPGASIGAINGGSIVVREVFVDFTGKEIPVFKRYVVGALGVFSPDVNAFGGRTKRYLLMSTLRMNAHHYLMNLAWHRRGERPRWTPPLQPGLDEGMARLEGPERRHRLKIAMLTYTQHTRGRSLVFDDDLIALRAHLAARHEEAAGLSGVAKELFFAVTDTDRSYGSEFYRPVHEPQNRAFIKALMPRLLAHEAEMLRRLSAVVGAPPPTTRVPIDIVAFGAKVGAYSTDNRITLASGDPDIQGDAALEMVAHETSHLDAFEPALREAINKAFAAEGKKPPKRLWHALIFFTAGELTRQLLASKGVSYEHYAKTTGVYARQPALYGPLLPLLREHWVPFVTAAKDDSDARHRALRAVAKGLPSLE